MLLNIETILAVEVHLYLNFVTFLSILTVFFICNKKNMKKMEICKTMNQWKVLDLNLKIM